MQYSVGVEYALHCLVYLGSPNIKSVLTVKELAAFQNLSETYLSKILTKLSKSGLVRATPGVSGGYQLNKPSEDISFWDAVEAVEGKKPIFQCKKIIDSYVINEPHDNKEQKEHEKSCESSSFSFCQINKTMLEAEKQMENYLREKSIKWLCDTLEKKLTKQYQQMTADWFNK